MQSTKAVWEQKDIQGLGIYLTANLLSVAPNNLVPLINSVKNTLENWSKLKLSWMGRIAAVKMKILQRFLFIFQNMIAVLPRTLLQKIYINDFTRGGNLNQNLSFAELS